MLLLWLQANMGTIIVGLILLVIVGLIVRSILKDKRKGKSSCGCGCANCTMHCQSHQKI
jgi:hypothetical protein